jgi:hypothetical protein
LNRFWACFMGIWLVYARIVDEFYRFLKKILSSSVKPKQGASWKLLPLVHQFLFFFARPHSFGLCKAREEGVTNTMNFNFVTLLECIPAIS